MSYVEFFQTIEKSIAEKLKLSCMSDLVHEPKASSCDISNKDGTTTGGHRFLAIENKAYQYLNAWSNKFYPSEPVLDIKKLPIIKSIIEEGKYKVYIPEKDENNVEKKPNPYENPLTQHGNMFYVVFYACMSLFIEMGVEDKDYRYEDVNYSIINGYADSSKSLEDYKPTEQEFYKRAEYWNVRGYLYELLADVETCFYDRYNAKFNDLMSYIDTKQREFEREYPNKETVETTECSETVSTREISSVETFWGEGEGSNYAILVSKVDAVFKKLEEDVNNFHIQLLGIVGEYIDIYNKMSKWLSKGDTFISALQKTSYEPNSCLANTFDKVNTAGSFSRYSKGSMDFIYDLFLEAKEMRDTSKYKDIDDYNIYLRKYMTYVILKEFKFYEVSVRLEDAIAELRRSLIS